MNAALILFLALLVSTTALALVRGGAPERVTAALFLAAPPLTYLAASPLKLRYRHLEVGILTIDAAMLAVLLWLAIRANRSWPILMTAMQAIVVLSHFAILLDPRRVRFVGYWVIEARISFAMIVLLAVATLLHIKRVQTLGHDRSWRA